MHHAAGMGGTLLLQALTAFTNLLLKGIVPLVIGPLLLGASLTALTKKDGGMRPIAVGWTLGSLVAKTANKDVMRKMRSYLARLQLGYSTPLGAKVVAYSS